jgi:hypothetical protein
VCVPVLKHIIHFAHKILKLAKPGMNTLQIRINIHRLPGQKHHPSLNLAVKILQMWLEECFCDGRHQTDHTFVFFERKCQLVDKVMSVDCGENVRMHVCLEAVLLWDRVRAKLVDKACQSTVARMCACMTLLKRISM